MTGASIFVVEDEGIVALDIIRRLELLGFQVLGVADTGEEAVQKTGELRPDLVLMDVKLKGQLDGVQAAEQIRRHYHIPVIYITAYADAQTVERIKISEPYGYILKPIETRELTTQIEMALYKHKMERALQEREQYYRTLIENISDVISIIGPDGALRYVGASVQDVLGFAPAELVGRIAIDLVHPDEAAWVRDEFRRAMREQKMPIRLQFRVQDKSGAWHFIESLGQDRLNDPVVSGLIVNSREISAQVQTLKTLRQRSSELARSNATLAALSQVAGRIASAFHTDEVFTTLGVELEGLGLTCAVLLLEPGSQVASISYTSLRPDLLGVIEQTIGLSILGLALAPEVFSESIWDAQYHADVTSYLKDILPMPEGHSVERTARLAGIPPFTPIICLPMRSPGNLVGWLTVWGPGLRREDIPTLLIFANQVAVAIERARLFSQVQKLALTDPLLGIYNRRHFFDSARQELERAIRYGEAVSLLMWDIDHFKLVNDTFGHQVGDAALVGVAQRCQENLRKVDLFGRYGGEEFVALLPETGLESARQVADRLRLAIGDSPFIAGGQPVSITISIGAATLERGSGNLERLLHQADQALLAAKASGRNRIGWFEPGRGPFSQ